MKQIIFIGILSSILLQGPFAAAETNNSFWITGHSKFNEGTEIATERMIELAQAKCDEKNQEPLTQVSPTKCYGYLSHFSCMAQFQCNQINPTIQTAQSQSCKGQADGTSCGSKYQSCYKERCVFHWD